MLIFSLLLNMQSHPTWVRGLKLIYHYEENTENDVAPYVGAWIETSPQWMGADYLTSHPTWVRGLKLFFFSLLLFFSGRTLRGCVD